VELPGAGEGFQAVRGANPSMSAKQISAKKNRKPAKASGPHKVEGSGGGLLDGEIAARETDEAEQASAEEGQGVWLRNGGRGD
jgi:hypothetical protein